MMRAGIAIAMTTAVLVVPAAPQAQTPRPLVPAAPQAQTPRKNINDASLAALKQWIAAVHDHTPGRGDDAVRTVAAWSYETREDLNTGITLYLAALMGWGVNTDGNKVAEAIVALGHAEGRTFLKRAAVLHADAAAYADLHPMRTSEPPRPARRPGADPIPPLLMGDPVILNKDGEVVGETASTWNWPFARALLDLLAEGRRKRVFSDGRPEPATDPFVAAWYHASAAYMFASGLYGDATDHLHHASMALADDPWMLFDRACYAEILGLPMHQALVSDQQRRDAASAPGWILERSIVKRIPTAEKTNAEAERLFRRALEVDPSLAEARIRLARLLTLRGANDLALAEASKALEGELPAVPAFYAHLFAGRAAQALGRMDEASAHYAKANALFPDAQSALLASSQLALLRSDVAGAAAPLEHLGPRSADAAADPWWKYHLAAGRDAESLLRTLWARVPAPPGTSRHP